jgi:hypothetical protein
MFCGVEMDGWVELDDRGVDAVVYEGGGGGAYA